MSVPISSQGTNRTSYTASKVTVSPTPVPVGDTEGRAGTHILQKYLEGNVVAERTHMATCDIGNGSTIRAEVIAETWVLSPPGRKWLALGTLA